MGDRRVALSTTCRGYPFVVYVPLTEAGRRRLTGFASSPDSLRIGDHEVTDDELRRGYWDPDDRESEGLWQPHDPAVFGPGSSDG